jgi:hypothetical protein
VQEYLVNCRENATGFTIHPDTSGLTRQFSIVYHTLRRTYSIFLARIYPFSFLRLPGVFKNKVVIIDEKLTFQKYIEIEATFYSGIPVI